MKKELTSSEWNKNYSQFIIINPDGWDRSNYDYSFNKELITEDVFMKRLFESTVFIREDIV